jgi:hypothetical protein
MARFIEYQQHRWRFIDLARSHHISPGALYHRLERFGETATGIARALGYRDYVQGASRKARKRE